MSENSREGVIFGLSAAAVALICVALVIGIVVVGYAVGGWFQVQNAKRQGTINNIQSHNYVHNYGYQQSQREAVATDMQEISGFPAEMIGQSEAERKALGGQRANALMNLCADAAKVDPSQGPLPQQAFVSANCSNGAANPSSPYETHADQPTP